MEPTASEFGMLQAWLHSCQTGQQALQRSISDSYSTQQPHNEDDSPPEACLFERPVRNNQDSRRADRMATRSHKAQHRTAPSNSDNFQDIGLPRNFLSGFPSRLHKAVQAPTTPSEVSRLVAEYEKASNAIDTARAAKSKPVNCSRDQYQAYARAHGVNRLTDQNVLVPYAEMEPLPSISSILLGGTNRHTTRSLCWASTPILHYAAGRREFTYQATEFTWATEFTPGHPEIVMELLALKLDPNIQTTTGASPLHWAAGSATAIPLLEAQADVNQTDRHGWQPLHYAAAFGQSCTTTHHAAAFPLHGVAELVAAGGSLTQPVKGPLEPTRHSWEWQLDHEEAGVAGARPVHLACRSRNYKILQALCTVGGTKHGKKRWGFDLGASLPWLAGESVSDFIKFGWPEGLEAHYDAVCEQLHQAETAALRRSLRTAATDAETGEDAVTERLQMLGIVDPKSLLPYSPLEIAWNADRNQHRMLIELRTNELGEVFDRNAHGRSGTLDTSVLHSLDFWLQPRLLAASSEEVRKMIADIDLGGSGTINFHQFVEMVMPLQTTPAHILPRYLTTSCIVHNLRERCTRLRVAWLVCYQRAQTMSDVEMCAGVQSRRFGMVLGLRKLPACLFRQVLEMALQGPGEVESWLRCPTASSPPSLQRMQELYDGGYDWEHHGGDPCHVSD